MPVRNRVLSATALLLLAGTCVQAANIWDGGGSDQYWTTPGNWDNNSVPTTYSSTTVTFGSGSGSNGAYLISNRSFGTLALTWDGGFALYGDTGFVTRTLGLYSGITVGDTQSSGTAYTLHSSVDIDLKSGNVWSVANPVAGGTNTLSVYGAVDLGDATLTVDGAGTIRVSGAMSGSGQIVKNGSGTLTMTGTSDYTGATTVNTGILDVSGYSALGTTAAGTTVADGAEVQLRDLGSTMQEAFTVAGHGVTGEGALRSTSGASNAISGDVALGADSTVGVDTGKLTISGDVSGAYALTKTGGGTLVLSGSNSYTGTTSVDAGVLTAGSAAAFGDSTAAVVLGADSGAADAALGTNTTLTRDVLVQAGSAGSATLTGSGGTFAGDIQLERDLTVTSGSSAITVSGSISGTYSITKAYNSLDSTSGTVEFSGANTYTGLTTVESGSLRVTHSSALGSTAAGTVVQSGGALQVRNGITVSGEALTISGTGFGLTGALVGSGNADWAGAVTLAADSSIGGVMGEQFTISGDIGDGAGAYRLQKVGDGTLILAGTNTYEGGTLISAGALRLAAAGALPANGMLTLGGGVLESSGSFTGTLGSDIAWDTGGGGFAAAGGNLSVNLNGTGETLSWGTGDFVGAGNTLMFGSSTADSRVTFANGIAIGGMQTGTVSVTDNASSDTDLAEIAGTVEGTGNLRKTGSGLLELSAANSLQGTIRVDGGTLRITDSAGLGDVSGGTDVARNATLELRSDSNLAVGNEALTLTGGQGATIPVSLRSAGADHSWGGNITLSPGYYNPAAVTVAVEVESGSLTLAGTVSGSTGGPALQKTGEGTLILSGTNTYTGETRIDEGTLRAGSEGALATTASVTVASGAVLDLNGTAFGGSLTCNGSVTGGTLDLGSGSILGGSGVIDAAVDLGDGASTSPGNSPGIQTYSSGLSYGAGSSYTWELIANDIGVAGVDYDRIAVTGGDLSIDPAAILDLQFDTNTVTFADPFWEAVREWTIIDFTSTGTSQGSFDSSLFATNLDYTTTGSFTTDNRDGDIVLTWMPFSIPEPGSLALLVAGGAALFLRRRRRS